VLALGLAATLPLAGCSPGVPQPFATLAEARRAIAALPATAGIRASGAWPLPQVLAHLAQSIEYSLRGFPALKPALFRGTVGQAAFAFFDARGRMQHPLDQPIPGAPSLDAEKDLAAAAARLVAAIDAFEAHGGELQPHFAYGVLDKPAYARAHLMHIGQHWSEVQGAA
jgi:hypothetical protein